MSTDDLKKNNCVQADDNQSSFLLFSVSTLTNLSFIILFCKGKICLYNPCPSWGNGIGKITVMYQYGPKISLKLVHIPLQLMSFVFPFVEFSLVTLIDGFLQTWWAGRPCFNSWEVVPVKIRASCQNRNPKAQIAPTKLPATSAARPTWPTEMDLSNFLKEIKGEC